MTKKMYQGLGRRKKSVARVILRPGSGKFLINKKKAEEYLQLKLKVDDVLKPINLTKNDNKFDVFANVRGGGISGQADAIKLGIARALLKVSEEYRKILRDGGLLTRDPRIKERKKPGLKKARKAEQYSKR